MLVYRPEADTGIGRLAAPIAGAFTQAWITERTDAMATVTTLVGDFEGPPWKQLFAETLINLCAALNPDVADEVADAEYRINKDLGPRLAAIRWAEREGQVPASVSRVRGGLGGGSGR